MSILVVEDSVLAQLRTLLGNKVRQVDSLPGDWDDEMLRRFLKLVPGVLLAFAGGTQSTSAGAAEARLQSRWIVYVLTGHPTEAARRRGDAQQLGAYQLVQLLLPWLHGLQVPDVGSMHLVDVQNLFTGTVERQGLTVYAITLGLEMAFELVPADELLAPFETFVAQYDLPPHTPALHPAWLIDDNTGGGPDARDDVQLPQP